MRSGRPSTSSSSSSNVHTPRDFVAETRRVPFPFGPSSRMSSRASPSSFTVRMLKLPSPPGLMGSPSASRARHAVPLREEAHRFGTCIASPGFSLPGSRPGFISTISCARRVSPSSFSAIFAGVSPFLTT